MTSETVSSNLREGCNLGAGPEQLTSFRLILSNLMILFPPSMFINRGDIMNQQVRQNSIDIIRNQYHHSIDGNVRFQEFMVSYNKVYPEFLGCNIPALVEYHYRPAVSRNNSEVVREVYDFLCKKENFQEIMITRCQSDSDYNNFTDMPLHVQFNITRMVYCDYYCPELVKPGELNGVVRDYGLSAVVSEFVLSLSDALRYSWKYQGQIDCAGHDNVLIKGHHIRYIEGMPRKYGLNLYEIDIPDHKRGDGGLYPGGSYVRANGKVVRYISNYLARIEVELARENIVFECSGLRNYLARTIQAEPSLELIGSFQRTPPRFLLSYLDR